MNRNLLRLGLALIALAAIVAPRAQAQDTDSPPTGGAINIIRPEIYLTEAGEAERRIGMPGRIEPGDSLRTGETGVALITWLPDATESVLGPDTQITLERFEGSEESGFDVALNQSSGELRMGIGPVGAANNTSTWRVMTPAFVARLFQGRFEVRVSDGGKSTLIVTEGTAEIDRSGDAPLLVAAHEFVTARPEEPPAQAERLSLDGVEVALTDVCTGVARANVNVRLAPSESSRRLGGLTEGQRFWVRAATEGRLWLQIYFRTADDDREAHDYGWVYGPIAELDEANCGALTAAPLDARIFGGPGVTPLGTVEPSPEPPASDATPATGDSGENVTDAGTPDDTE